MRRGFRKLGSSNAASTALSFLDIVSAGFGGAVFLFVVFASLPIDTRPPAVGGGGRFIDILVEWRRHAAGDKGHETANNDGDAPLMIKPWHPDHSQYIAANDFLGAYSDCAPLKAGETMVWKENVQYYELPLKNSKQERDCPEDYYFLTDAGSGRMALGELGRLREPLVDLHIVHKPLRGKPYQARLSALAGGIDPGTDTAWQREEMPWKSMHVTGFDPFGRYTRIGELKQPHTMHVRIREPRGGKWQFEAKVYSAGSGSGQDATAPIKVTVTVRCSQADDEADKPKTVDLPVKEFRPVPIEIPCEFEIGS